MSEFKYTEREKMIVDLYKQKIETLEERIKDLELIVKYNAELDAKKMSSVYRNCKDIKVYEFKETLPWK